MKNIRLLVCGGRGFALNPDEIVNPSDDIVRKCHNDLTLLNTILDYFNFTYGVAVVGHGDQVGADIASDAWAKRNCIPVQPYPVTREEWNKLGKKAGPLRNIKMADDFKPDCVVAFPGGTGTDHMCSEAKRRGIFLFKITQE